jgi:hypothetical protein
MGYTFDSSSTRRISTAVQIVEKARTPLGGEPLGTGAAPYETLIVRLTNDLGDGGYDWTQVLEDSDGNFNELDTPRTGECLSLDDGDFRYFADSDNGDVVVIRRSPVDNGDGSFGLDWVIISAPTVGVFFPVNLSFATGGDGDQTHPAAYTYNATDAITSNSIPGGPFSVTWARPNGKTNVASHGVGYITSGGSFVLYQADETPNTTGCTTS